jgi:hypothetical protein
MQHTPATYALGMMPRMRWVLGALVATVFAFAAPVAARAAQPVILGDVPDPTVIRAPEGFYAVATSKDWVPAFPVFFSSDLVHWRRVGSVLARAPAWAKGDFWAPELAWFGGLYRVYFAASRRRGRPCIGVATARHARGPWRDRGRALCPPRGAIDPKAVVDERGRPWLAYKRFGVRGGIWLRPLSRDGLRARGTARRIVAPRFGWQQATTEGPDLVRRPDAWYLVYSGGHCCRPPCSYAVGVARARSLLGRWEVLTAPSLTGDAQVKCPGHGTLVDDGAGRMWLLHHGYPVTDATDARRQAFLTSVTWGSDGWPAFGPLQPVTARSSGWSDEFAGRAPSDGWQWPASARPDLAVAGGALRLRAAGRDRSRLLARQVTLDDFAAEVTVAPGRCAAGLAVVGTDDRPIGVEAVPAARGRRSVRVWRGAGVGRTIARVDAGRAAARRVADAADPSLRLRAEVTGGASVRFAVWRDGAWVPAGDPVATARGVRILRVALTCAGHRGAVARFGSVRVMAR